MVDPITPVNTVVPEPPKSTSGESVEIPDTVSFIPDVDPTYVRFGHHKNIESIIKSEMFYPTFVTGLSGNGKTFMIEQVCAKLKRECIRVNITIETDEDDLLGGFRLINGETVFHKGPVVDAMERGAVLLLDEIDLASNKILCLQPVLEGKGVYLKKINEWVKPAKGFTILATANTKGKGSETGAFVGTQILNEAFLERFAITVEQEYATPAIEKKILLGHMTEFDSVDEDFATKLTNWADVIRRTYLDGGVDEIVSTRRLVHIVKAFGIFGDRLEAIKMCVSRFDGETKSSFLDLYTKVDEHVDVDGDEKPVPF
ncbi:porphyrin biosynthesis protein [Candidatus Poribacteria bacterium]|nr:porphyrin biosynthesis protein [Candidatus Poribacteria bacterium]